MDKKDDFIEETEIIEEAEMRKEKYAEENVSQEEMDFAELGLEEIPVDAPAEQKKKKGLLGFLKSRKPVFWYRVVIGACMAVFLYAAVNLVMIFVEYDKAKTTYENIIEEYVTYDDPVVDEADTNPEDAGGEGSQEEKEEKEDATKKKFKFAKANVDFEKLQKANKDVVGWIQFETFSLSYPIAHDNGSNYYLTHTINKKENTSGSIYIPVQNSGDFNDTNTIIIGHNMKNGTMFGLLGRYKEKSYYQYNQYFYIYTPEGDRKYQIFSVYIGDEDGPAYSIYGSHSEEYGKFLQSLKKQSMYETGVEVGLEDKIVTLSTCVTSPKTKRLILHAKLVD